LFVTDVKYLLDTNTASYVIKGRYPLVDRRLARASAKGIAISSITEAELRFGGARLHQATRLHALIEDFLLRVTILPWDSPAAQQYGPLRASLERDETPMGNLDLMIAAHALALNLMLVTNDRAFARIKNLRLEDWTKQ
jgi:tRNA(fMet)-specific endonuclease VapC